MERARRSMARVPQLHTLPCNGGPAAVQPVRAAAGGVRVVSGCVARRGDGRHLCRARRERRAHEQQHALLGDLRRVARGADRGEPDCVCQAATPAASGGGSAGGGLCQRQRQGHARGPLEQGREAPRATDWHRRRRGGHRNAGAAARTRVVASASRRGGCAIPRAVRSARRALLCPPGAEG